MSIQNHHGLWQEAATILQAELEAYERSDYLDRGVKGRDAECAFRDWLSLFLPARVEALEGVVIGAKEHPSTQRDVVVFDVLRCPVFKRGYRATEVNLIPIEGVLGLVEVNASEMQGEKLRQDFDKLSKIKKLQYSAPPFEHHPLVLKKSGAETGFRGEVGQTPDGTLPYQIVTELFGRHQRFAYVFARDSVQSLETIAKNLIAHNKSHKVDCSVDGVFILRKGVVLHCNTDGWQTTRTGGADVKYMKAEPWDVLLLLVSILNKHLSLGARGSMPELEEYFAASEFDRKSYFQGNAHSAGDTEYKNQGSSYRTVG